MPDAGRRLSRPHAALMRVVGLLRKEFLQIMRDPSSIALALVMPVVLLILFGYGVTFDAENIQVALVLDDHGSAAQALAAQFEGSRYFLPQRVGTLDEARGMLMRRDIAGIVYIQSDFDRVLDRGGEAPVQVLVDGIDANRARLIAGYANGLIGTFNTNYRRGLGPPPGGVTQRGAQLDTRIWFNPTMDSHRSLVPGLVALIMTLTGLLLTALVLVREKERGTMEALFVTPVRASEIMVAKLIPYFTLGMLGLVMTVGLGRLLFGIPLAGSVLTLLGISSVFMLASLGLGLLISAVAPGQMVASQISLVLGFLPAFFLSGLLFDIQAQPAWTHPISAIIPTTYFIDATKTIFLAGDYWSVLARDTIVLSAMALVLLGLARRKIRKRLA